MKHDFGHIYVTVLLAAVVAHNAIAVEGQEIHGSAAVVMTNGEFSLARGTGCVHQWLSHTQGKGMLIFPV